MNNFHHKEKPLPGGSRVILFIAGGMTFSEMRSAYEVGEKLNRQVIIGSTSILTPKQYVNSLKSLKKIESLGIE